MNYALSWTQPDQFGEIDQDEINLICNGAYDLLLLENASEVFRQTMMEGEVLEYVLNEIVGHSSTCLTLTAGTFPYYVPPEFEMEEEAEEAYIGQEALDGYNEAVIEYKKINNNNLKTIDKNRICAVAIVSVDLKELTTQKEFGGHYAALIYRDGIVSIFDSMQSAGYEGSLYTPFFKRLVLDIFNPNVDVQVPECIMDNQSLQRSGGFLGVVPYESRNYSLSPWEENELMIQSTESQNHFCYMWAIWYINLKLNNINVQNIIDNLTENPLIVIKSYIWNLVHLLGLNDQMEYYDFFKKHFPAIWIQESGPLDFKRYNLTFEKATDINDALQISFNGRVTKRKVKNIPVPKAIKERYCMQA